MVKQNFVRAEGDDRRNWMIFEPIMVLEKTAFGGEQYNLTQEIYFTLYEKESDKTKNASI